MGKNLNVCESVCHQDNQERRVKAMKKYAYYTFASAMLLKKCKYAQCVFPRKIYHGFFCVWIKVDPSKK